MLYPYHTILYDMDDDDTNGVKSPTVRLALDILEYISGKVESG